jgi:hypothetical protein
MFRVPSTLRQQIAGVLADLRSRMSKKSPSNQHVCHSTGSVDFPWKLEEHDWPVAFTLQRPVTFTDVLLPKFGRLCFVAPGKAMPHSLPNGGMPCKWHGFDHDCVLKNGFFNPNGPCPFFDSDGKACHVICSKRKRSTREKEQADKRAIDNDESMDDHCNDREGSKAHDGDFFSPIFGLDDILPCPFPKRQHTQEVFVSCVLDPLPVHEKGLMRVSGTVLCADQSHKTVKFACTATGVDAKSVGQESVRACDSICSTVMNEHDMVVAMHPTRVGDCSEIESMLKQISLRCKTHGYDEVKLFYTDNCCHECKMLVRAFPSLCRNDVNTPPAADSAEECFLDLPSVSSHSTTGRPVAGSQKSCFVARKCSRRQDRRLILLTRNMESLPCFCCPHQERLRQRQTWLQSLLLFCC